jgi:hypothetical protein
MYVDMKKLVSVLPNKKDLISVTYATASLHSQRKIEHGLNKHLWLQKQLLEYFHGNTL